VVSAGRGHGDDRSAARFAPWMLPSFSRTRDPCVATATTGMFSSMSAIGAVFISPPGYPRVK